RIDDAPAVYEPGRQYTLRVVTQQTGRQRFGFQLTAIDKNGERVGTLAPLGGDSQLNPVTGEGGRQYINHTQAGVSSTSSGTRLWLVRWTAPATDKGTVRFFVAGNAANGDGTNQNDYIYTNSFISESPTTVVIVSFETDVTGLTLEAGSRFTIDWNATNPSNVASYDVRYSTDDGATFPITNLIFATTDANITSFDWTVPDVPTDRARIRVQASTRSGAAVEIRSGKFTINGSGEPAPAVPAILSAEVIGKHLYVNGNNFQQGAKVEMNSVKIKTKNEEDFSHRLRCKKSGKKIARGQTVMLKVINPDNSESELFPYTRPQ
ncbi:MAG TPA: choice-of-anchor V domain-containing protein, partial [Blastocatellia bacterium]|nr:choice-of-anchor V domain-containing protein [Blastocatellia bacterium]